MFVFLTFWNGLVNSFFSTLGLLDGLTEGSRCRADGSNDRFLGQKWRVPRVEAIDKVCPIVAALASFEAEEQTKNKNCLEVSHTKYRIMGLATEVLSMWF